VALDRAPPSQTARQAASCEASGSRSEHFDNIFVRQNSELVEQQMNFPFTEVDYQDALSAILKLRKTLPVAQFAMAARDPMPREIDQLSEVQEHR
jgi:hypothetical protein